MIIQQQEKRGNVTADAEKYYKEATGRNLTTRELRLLPYVHHCIINGGTVEAIRVNIDEITILQDLAEDGFIIFQRKPARVGYYDIAPTEEFFGIINHVLWMTYASQAVKNGDTD